MKRASQPAASLSDTRSTSLSDYLLPFLFGAMETCWVDALLMGIASLHLFQVSDTLLPFWAPFVYLVGFQLLARLLSLWSALHTSKTRIPARWAMTAVISFNALVLIWWRVYAQTAFFFDPHWLGALFDDLAGLRAPIWTVFAIAVLTPFFCLRAITFEQHEDKPLFLSQTFLLGMGVIVMAILVITGRNGVGLREDLALFVLIPLFLFFLLAAHALAQAAYIRRYHLAVLDGSVAEQERSIVLWICLFGLLLLSLTLLIITVTHPSVLEDIQRFVVAGYNWLVDAFATVVTFLLTPFIWLIALILLPLGKGYSTNMPLQGTFCSNLLQREAKIHHHLDCPVHSIMPTGVITNDWLVLFFKIALPALVLFITMTLVRRAARHRHIRQHIIGMLDRQVEEVHESLWSWSLFLSQIKAFCLVFLRRLFPQNSQKAAHTMFSEVEAAPAARSVRGIYRTLLKQAARRGYPRAKNETPYEFQQRLSNGTPLAEPRLAMITDEYIAIRYGGTLPDEAETQNVQQLWKELEKKWD